MSKKPKLPKDPLLQQLEREIKQMKRNVSKPVKTERGVQKRAEQMGIKLPKYNNLTKAEKIAKQNEYLARRSTQQMKKHQKAVDQLKRGGSSVYQLGGLTVPKSMLSKSTKENIKKLQKEDMKKQAYILSNGRISESEMESIKTKKQLIELGIKNGFNETQINRILNGKGVISYQSKLSGGKVDISDFTTNSFDIFSQHDSINRVEEGIKARVETQSLDYFMESIDVMGYTKDVMRQSMDGNLSVSLTDLEDIETLSKTYKDIDGVELSNIQEMMKNLNSSLGELTPVQKMLIMKDDYYQRAIDRSSHYFNTGGYDEGVKWLEGAINRVSAYKNVSYGVI